MEHFDVAVVGLGVLESAAAYQTALGGKKVVALRSSSLSWAICAEPPMIHYESSEQQTHRRNTSLWQSPPTGTGLTWKRLRIKGC